MSNKKIILSLVVLLIFVIYLTSNKETFAVGKSDVYESNCNSDPYLGSGFYDSPMYWTPRLQDNEYLDKKPPYFYEGDYGFNLWKRPFPNTKNFIQYPFESS